MTASERREEALRLRAEGRSLREIAKTLGVSVTQVRRDLADGTPDGTPDGTGAVQGGHTSSDGTIVPSSEPFSDSKADSKAAKADSKVSEVSSSRPIRERMASDFEGLYDEIREELGKATRLTKKIWLTCRSCSKRTLVDVPDVKSLLDTLTFLADRGIGKPNTADSESAAEPVIFVNTLVLEVEDEQAFTAVWLEERGFLAEPLAVVAAEWEFDHATPPDQAQRLREIRAAVGRRSPVADDPS